MTEDSKRVRPTTAAEEKNLVEDLGLYQREKLSENRGKDHWRCTWASLSYLLGRLREEVGELEASLVDSEWSGEVWREAADIANFAAMIADRYERGPFFNE